MSGQHGTNTEAIGLEELFLSREFGRRPAHRVSPAAPAFGFEPVELAQLEQVFLSELFGHPEALVIPAQPVPTFAGPPTLLLLKGGGEGSNTRTRAIAAVSGVAAAALVVAGLASGNAQRPGQPSVTAQAQGASPNQAGRGPAAPPAEPDASGTAAPAGSGTSGGGTTFVQLTSVSTPSTPVTPSGTTGGGPAVTPPPSASAPGGGPAPGPPTGSGSGGGGGMLAPAVNAVGTAVSNVGSTVSTASSAVGQALPVSSLTGALGALATSAVDDLGGGSPPTIVASVLR